MQGIGRFALTTDWRFRIGFLSLAVATMLVLVSVFSPATLWGSPQAKIIPAGTELVAELTDELDTRLLDEEGRFTLRLTQSVRVGATEVIPRGAQIIGKATSRQDEDGNYSTLVLNFQELAIGMRTLPVAIKVKALEPPAPPREGVPTDPNAQRLPGEPDRQPGQMRRPRIETSGGVSIRKIEDPTAGLRKPSKAGLRRESVELMKVSEAESGASELFLEGQDIALRHGTRFRIVLAKDLVIN